MLRAMILVGLTGGVATGKSTVARMFEQCGATVISADVLAREVVGPGKSAWREIVAEFGRSILKPDRTVDRQGLGEIVFRNPRKRRKLEHIIHPRVARLQAGLTRSAAKKNPHAVVVYEVPLLFEAGVDRRVDRIVVVTAPRATQIVRLKTRDGLPRNEALRRIDSQLPLNRKIARADAVLNGAVPLPALRAEVQKLYRHFQRLA
ncbi:MAG: dephospho-CoA kinase [Nitrospira sp.]|nr:dephospho-CoA kinase [Nitrospira sp.]